MKKLILALVLCTVSTRCAQVPLHVQVSHQGRIKGFGHGPQGTGQEKGKGIFLSFGKKF